MESPVYSTFSIFRVGALVALGLALSLAGCSDEKCTSTSDCVAGEICHNNACITCIAVENRCVVCTETEGCEEGKVCDTTMGAERCVDCLSDGQCTGNAFRCLAATSTCVECVDNADCGEGRVCDTKKNTCVACLEDADCPTGAPVCDATKNVCIECDADRGCAETEICADAVCAPRRTCATSDDCVCPAEGVCDGEVCDLDLLVCVACTATEGCAENQVCDRSVSGGTCRECAADADCLTEGKPFCGPDFTCLADPIVTARAAADGSSLTLPVAGVVLGVVSFPTPNREGFFIQYAASGPAIFARTPLAKLTPSPAKGDRVSFTATALATAEERREITGIEDWRSVTQGETLEGFVKSLEPDVAPGLQLANMESHRVGTAEGVLTAPTRDEATGGDRASLTLPAGAGDVPVELSPEVQAAFGLVAGCTLSLEGLSWRHDAEGTLLVLDTDSVIGFCPAAKLVGVETLSSTEVKATFDRPLDPAFSSSLAGWTIEIPVPEGAEEGTVAERLAIESIAFEGSAVMLVTAAQTPCGRYTLVASADARDRFGTFVDSEHRSLHFDGYTEGGCGAAIVISQIYAGGQLSNAWYRTDYVELFNRGPVSITLENWTLQLAGTGSSNWSVSPLTGTVAPGGWFLIGLASGTEQTEPLGEVDLAPTPNLQIPLDGFTLALVKSATKLTGTCPQSPQASLVSDLVGVGSDCSEGSPAPEMSTITALVRAGGGCADTGNNAVDFSLADLSLVEAVPRTASTPAIPCTP